MNVRDSIVSICVSDDCPACLLSIDSYHSDIQYRNIIFAEIDQVYM